MSSKDEFEYLEDGGSSIKEVSTRGDSIPNQDQLDGFTSQYPQTNDQTHVHDQRQALIKTAYHKIDRHLLIFYSVVYLFMKLSARNITNTAIINLEQGTGIKYELGNLTSEQWAWILSIFFYPYIVFEPFSTIALKWFRPSRWMGRIMLTWVRRHAVLSK